MYILYIFSYLNELSFLFLPSLFPFLISVSPFFLSFLFILFPLFLPLILLFPSLSVSPISFIYSNSVVVRNETTPGSYIITGLSPYTLYTARIRVCTSYGCNHSDLTSNRTLQSGMKNMYTYIQYDGV